MLSLLGKGLSESDMRIVRELSVNASQTSEQLAGKLGLAPSTVRQKVAKLLKSGVVRIIGVPDPSVIAYHGWAVLGINTSPSKVDSVVRELAQSDAIYTIASSLGQFDVIALAQFATIDELQVFTREKLPKVVGVKGIEVFVLTRPKKYHGIIWED